MEKITPCLWFDSRAEEAVAHYTSVFPHSRILETVYATEGAPGPTDAVLTLSFELSGRRFLALNGGPHDQFNDAVSLSVDCADQAEVDHYWERLGEGGQYVQCGWLKDAYGVSWQIVPRRLTELLGGPDRERADRVVRAMLTMQKLDIAQLEAAAG